jgi:hypothetical protein
LSPNLVRELAQLTRSSSEALDSPSGKPSAATRGFGGDNDGLLPPAAEENVAVVWNASSPPSLTLGVVASLGFASSLTVPSRRRTATWVQRLAQLVGLS